MQYFYWTLVSAEIDFKLFLDKIPLLLFVVETRKNSLTILVILYWSQGVYCYSLNSISKYLDVIFISSSFLAFKVIIQEWEWGWGLSCQDQTTETTWVLLMPICKIVNNWYLLFYMIYRDPIYFSSIHRYLSFIPLDHLILIRFSHKTLAYPIFSYCSSLYIS